MKNKIALVLIFAFLVFVSFYYGGQIKKNALVANDVVISNIYDLKDFLASQISKHFNQAEKIALLEAKNKELERSSVLLSTFANELNRILEDQNTTQFFPQVSLSRVISFVQPNDYKKVWLDSAKSSPNKNKGLIFNGYTAGILVDKDGRAMGLLQGDEKCVFSVYIGKEKVPGLIQGKDGRAIINFIPKWANLNVGDEVLTSGLDDIFFEGVPVGEITQIIDEKIYQSAEIKPFAKPTIPAYLYVVEKL